MGTLSKSPKVSVCAFILFWREKVLKKTGLVLDQSFTSSPSFQADQYEISPNIWNPAVQKEMVAMHAFVKTSKYILHI